MLKHNLCANISADVILFVGKIVNILISPQRLFMKHCYSKSIVKSLLSVSLLYFLSMEEVCLLISMYLNFFLNQPFKPLLFFGSILSLIVMLTMDISYITAKNLIKMHKTFGTMHNLLRRYYINVHDAILQKKLNNNN